MTDLLSDLLVKVNQVINDYINPPEDDEEELGDGGEPIVEPFDHSDQWREKIHETGRSQ